MKKLTIVLLVLTMFLGGAWLLLKFAPDSISRFSAFSSKEEPTVKTAGPTPTDYLAWRDSLDHIDLQVRSEQDPRVLRSLKERQKYYWKKLQSVRESLPPLVEPAAQATQATPSSSNGLIPFLSKVLTITALALVLIIIALLMLLKKRRTALTRHLEAIHNDLELEQPIRAPRVPKKHSRANSPNSMPDTSALDLSALAESLVKKDASVPVQLRPTAKQRVTQALKGLSEALTALKSESSTTGTPVVDQEKSRVRSQNILRPTQAAQVLAPSRFEREQEDITEILKLARRGFTPSEIARRLRMAQDQVETVVRMHRDGDSH